jgi:hypothetical protein
MGIYDIIYSPRSANQTTVVGKIILGRHKTSKDKDDKIFLPSVELAPLVKTGIGRSLPASHREGRAVAIIDEIVGG